MVSIVLFCQIQMLITSLPSLQPRLYCLFKVGMVLNVAVFQPRNTV